MTQAKEGMLSPYRVLDLADEKGLFCGKLLGDLGADVIKVERPGGDAARLQGPFYHDEAHPEKSLFWDACNTSKRGITLGIEKKDGQTIFRRLAAKADFIIESFSPGRMDSLGLGYAALQALNPGIILVSITPFGQTGPYRDYKGPDIVVWSMGGRVYAVGDEDRPPVRMSHHSQAYMQAGVEGAMAAMMALYHRQATGEGEHIDLSIQAAAAQPSNTAWDIRRVVQPRGLQSTNINVPRIWQCKDGTVAWYFMPGQTMPGRNQRFIAWMESEGVNDEFLKTYDWDNFDYATITQETMDRIAQPTAQFFRCHTKVELLEGAVKHRIMFYPTFSTTNILESAQLAARDFWVKIPHPELGGEVLTYPGPFARASETPITVSRRAPLIGEHNREVYEGELGMSPAEVQKLRQDGVI